MHSVVVVQKFCLVLQEEEEGLISIGGGSGGAVAAAAPAPVTAPAAAVDEGSSLLSHDEQQEAFFADPTSNGTPPGMHQLLPPCHADLLTLGLPHAQETSPSSVIMLYLQLHYSCAWTSDSVLNDRA